MIKKHIGVLLFDNFNMLDVAGPVEVFNIAKDLGNINYQVSLIGLEKIAYPSETGSKMLADLSISDKHNFDTLIIPGGKGARCQNIHEQHNAWLTTMLTKCRRVVSVCTGSYLLASTGALDSKKATTHWYFVNDFQAHYPKVEVLDDCLYLDHGQIATSAGITSGIDLALKLIEKDCGTDIAIKVARFLVLHYRRSGSQAQFSEPLQYQSLPDNQFSDLVAWIVQNLTQDLSIATLAAKVCMSERSFCRKFKQQMNNSPAKHVELLRLDRAKQLLIEKDWPIQKVADACGYKNVDVFRRGFERKYAIAPNTYRANLS